jgi:hypothetical protein
MCSIYQIEYSLSLSRKKIGSICSRIGYRGRYWVEEKVINMQGWGRLHNEKLHNLYSSPKNIWLIK